MIQKVCHRHRRFFVAGERCPQCAERDRTRDSYHWRRLRLQRLQFDGWRCRLKLEGCTGHATTVHLALEAQGNHRLATLDNTLSACRRCHGALHGG